MQTRSLAAFLSLAVCCAASARAQTLEWIRQLDSGEGDYGHDVSVDGLGNVYISGSTDGTLGGSSAGRSDAFLAKYDASGNLQWTEQLGTSETDNARGVSTDGQGNVYISGGIGGHWVDGEGWFSDVFLAKYDASATQEWIRQFGILQEDNATGVSADGLGNVYISGSTRGWSGGTAGDTDGFLAKYDSNGTHEWTRQFGTSELDCVWGCKVSADGLGNVYISGDTQGSSVGGTYFGGDAFLAKYDASGNLQWTEQLGTSETDVALGVSADGLGNVYISGYTAGNLGGSIVGLIDAFLAKYDASGNLQWIEQHGTGEVDGGRAVFADGLGNVYLSGATGGGHQETRDAYLSKYDDAGTLQWTQQFGAWGYDQGSGVSADGSGKVYISGRQGYTSNGGDSDAFLAKYVDLPPLQADFDGDGDVDGNDFLAWQVGFGDFPSGGAQKSDGDYDNDGDVDGNDFLGWQTEFGSGGNAAAVAVPEPASLLLLLAALSLLLTRSILRNGARAHLC